MADTAQKKPLWKRPLVYVIFGLILLACFIAIGLFRTSPLVGSKKLDLAGYSFLLPDQWDVRLEKEVAVFYNDDESGAPIGMARLINRELKTSEFGKVFSFASVANEEQTLSGYPAPLCAQRYDEDDSTKVLYVFSELPNPAPYYVAVYFEDSSVSKEQQERILKSFYIPDAGSHPPAKNIPAPPEETAQKDSFYTVEKNGEIAVFHPERLENTITQIQSGQPASLRMLSYRIEGNTWILEDWKHIDYDGDKTRLYRYYQMQDGLYGYNNNPTELKDIALTKDEEAKTVSFTAIDVKKGELTEPIVSYPMNSLKENTGGSFSGISSSEDVAGNVVFSSSVTIHSGQKVTHPRTGEKVVVDPYAKRYGYAKYLDKPISCKIYRTKTGYRAVASCGGTVLLEQYLRTERDKDYAISVIKAYGG